MYGAILMGCYGLNKQIHIGQPNETSWYFDTPLIKYFNFSDTDKLSSMSSDPSWSASVTLPPTYQIALIGPSITYKHIQD